KAGDFENAKVRAILHQGACSNTLEDDGRYMMDNNFTYSKELLHFALDRKIPLVYASTAAIYGASTEFTELPKHERPLNVYGYSKRLAPSTLFFAGLPPDNPRQPTHAVVNAGTGEARTFNAVAAALMQVHGPGKIDYIPFPGDLRNRYQHYTQADITNLRAAG